MEELSLRDDHVADLVVEAVTIDNSVERIPGTDHLRTITRLKPITSSRVRPSRGTKWILSGGRLGRETHLESAPIFTPDERVLVFLEQRKGEWKSWASARAS